MHCGNDGELLSLKELCISHQGDEVSEGQLDLNFQLVFRMNHRANILAVVTEQVAYQLGLLIALHCMNRNR